MQSMRNTSNPPEINPLEREISSFVSALGKTKPWILTTIGLIEIIVGFLILLQPLFAGLISIWIAGWFFLFMAGMQLFQLFGSRTHGILWSIISLLLYTGVGIYMISEPGNAMGWWTLALGIYILVSGIFRLALALQFRGSPGSGIAIFNGVITTLLGAIVTFTWPGSSIWVIGTVVAVELLMTGWTMLYLSTIAGKVKDEEE